MTRKSQPAKEDSGAQGSYHVPVLLPEAIEALEIRPSGIYVDCTFGGGGHARAILKRLDEKGRLLVFDQDEDARENLPADKRVEFIPYNFRHIGRFLKLHHAFPVDGILADLGVSSHQFDEAGRGFSTRYDGPLDMRMDRRQTHTAARLLNQAPEAELHKIFEWYGEVTNARTLAHTIEQYRKSVPLKTILQFKEAVQQVVKGNPNKYFAQVFQALRIAVNDEMGALEEMLEQVPALLKPDGRIVVITFHSLEDRIVKHFFRYGRHGMPASDEIYGGRPESSLQVISKKPVLPGEKELKRNPRSRSAKLRVAMKKDL
jgi:16S rRNA (cytosine1402-N4)-methyltransferase